MIKKQIFSVLIIVLLFPSVYAKDKDSIPEKRNHYSLTVGVGWTHYINTLEIGKDNATINSAGVSLKFFWEPEHRLSLGLESGFYRLYKVTVTSETGVTGEVTMSAVPLLLTVRMRIVDNFYLSAGAGLALMFNKVQGIDDKITSKVWSLSNYQFSGSYLYPLSKHWRVGGELKVINFGKASDWMYTLQALCVVRF